MPRQASASIGPGEGVGLGLGDAAAEALAPGRSSAPERAPFAATQRKIAVSRTVSERDIVTFVLLRHEANMVGSQASG
jgi:hypothetical protein